MKNETRQAADPALPQAEGLSRALTEDGTADAIPDRQIVETRLPLPDRERISIAQREGEFLLIDADRPSWVVLNLSAMEILNKAWEGKTIAETIQELAAAYQLPVGIMTEELIRFAGSWEKNPFRQYQETRVRDDLIVSLYLEITNGCQQRCSHCFCALAEGDHDRVYMSTEQLAGLLANRSVFSAKPHVILTGGEPTLHPRLLEMLEIAKCAGGTVELHTNGQAEDPAFWDRVIEKADAIRVSLDGADADTHNRLRGAGTFENARRTLDHLQGRGYPAIEIAFTPTTDNLSQMPQMVRLAKRLGASLLYVNELVPTEEIRTAGLFYTDKEFEVQLELLESNYSRLVQWISGTKEMESFRLIYHSYRDIRRQLKGHNFRAENCGLGSKIIYVRANGDSYPCWATQVPSMKLGNVFEESLDSVHRRGIDLNGGLSVEKLQVCRECSFRLFCRGGCRARSLHLLGEAEALDPSHDWLFSTLQESVWRPEGRR